MMAESDRAIAVCAGMGREAVTRSMALAETRGTLSMMISVGYAGALRPGIASGSLHWPAIVIDAQTEERFDCDRGSGTLLTVDSIVDAEEKMRYTSRWSADLVDMEAATVARWAQARHLPFRTLRAVSDEAGEKLPALNRFIDERGGFREYAFARHIALRPWLIPTAIRLGKHSGHASRAMANALRELLDEAE